jgi:uncharacterized protein YegP (UPF0339 family)
MTDDAQVLQAELFKGAGGDFYWHIKADNGEIIADGSESYRNRDDALSSLALGAPHAHITDLTEVPTE